MNRKGSSGGIKSFVITVAFIFLFTVALLLDIQYLYLMAVMLALIQPIAYGMVALAPTQYAAQRRHPLSAVEGRPLKVTLDVQAKGKLPALMLEVDETTPESLLRLGKTGAVPLETWDGFEGSLSYQLSPLLRGIHLLGPAKVELSDPLGLFTFSAELAAATDLIVHPSPIGIRVGLSGGEGRIGVREREGKAQRGEGMEFHGVRQYHPGDSLRRVHWRTSARTGNLAVVEFERAFEQDLVIGLDLKQGTHVGAGREATLEYAIKIAATLVDKTLAREGGVMLVTQVGAVKVDPRERDPEAARHRLFDHLARAQATSDQSLAGALGAHQHNSGTRFALLSAQPDTTLLGFITERLHKGDQVRLYFTDPKSFGGPTVPVPALPGRVVQVIERIHSPWEEGGRRLEQILRQDD